MNREAGGPPAEINLVPEKIVGVVDRAGRVLIAELSAEHPHVGDRGSDPAEHDRADGSAVRAKAGLEDRVVAEVHELAHFAVVPVEETDASANERLDRTAADRQETYGRGERNHAQLQILFDFGIVRMS